jgi:hypothetical protein
MTIISNHYTIKHVRIRFYERNILDFHFHFHAIITNDDIQCIILGQGFKVMPNYNIQKQPCMLSKYPMSGFLKAHPYNRANTSRILFFKNNISAVWGIWP